MATIIENRAAEPMNRSVLVDGNTTDSGAGWAVAVLILVVAIVGLAFWYMRYHAPAVTSAPGSTVQVNLPASGQPSSATTNTTQTTSQTPATSGSVPATSGSSAGTAPASSGSASANTTSGASAGTR